MTQQLFRNDAYLQQCDSQVVAITESGAIELSQTVFYPTGGGQPGDCGILVTAAGDVAIATTVMDKKSGQLLHIPAEGQSTLAQLKPGDEVTAKLDWQRRYQHMRMHTALHLLCAIVPCGVTGGQIGEVKSRLDFDVGEVVLDKLAITAALNQLITSNQTVSSYWISDQELAENPQLVRTMSVQPPSGSGQVRLIQIGENIDLQPCGGTHLKRTAEIGEVCISKIENKGKRNRRVNLVFG